MIILIATPEITEEKLNSCKCICFIERTNKKITKNLFNEERFNVYKIHLF